MSEEGAGTCRGRGGFKMQRYKKMGRRATPSCIEAEGKSCTRLRQTDEKFRSNF